METERKLNYKESIIMVKYILPTWIKISDPDKILASTDKIKKRCQCQSNYFIRARLPIIPSSPALFPAQLFHN